MKSKNIVFMMLIFAGLLAFQSCTKDTSTPFKTYGAFTNPALVGPTDGAFLDLTGTKVTLEWTSADADGDPQNWDVYFGTSEDPARIQTGYTSQSISVDVVKGMKYFWRVVGHDANNIPTRSATWSFETVDPAAPMKMKMEWSSNALDKLGLEVDPLKAGNLRLLIRKADKTAQATVNTGGFEEYNNWNTLPDGKYYVATSLATTVDAGDFNDVLDFDINLTFSQRGVQYNKYEFPAVMTNQFACSTYIVYLGYVVKSGNNYTFTEEVVYPSSPLSFVWYGLDNTTDFKYVSQVETFMGCSLQIKGLSYEWMDDFWSEVIVKGGAANITINTTTGVVTIPNQFYCRTKYNGVVQPDYFIEGTGTYSTAGAFPTMTITYDLIQNGISMAIQDNGPPTNGTDTKFTAVLTLDPASAKGAVVKSARVVTRPAIKPAQK